MTQQVGPPTKRPSRVERSIPLRAHNPRKRRHSTAQQAPLEVIPSQVFPSVLSFYSLGRLHRRPQQRLLRFGQRLRATLDPLEPILVSVPPHFVPELVVG